MGHLAHDLRLAARSLLRQPGLALAAILTLALGIGVNTSIFSVVDAVLLTPPPFQDPGRLVVAWNSNPPTARAAGLPDKLPTTNAVFYDWRKESRSFAHLAMLQPDRMNLSGEGEPEQLGVVRVTGDFSTLLGTPAEVGRTLLPADDATDQAAAVLLSHAFWQRRYGGDPQVVGRKVTLNGAPMTIVGVMPPRFAFPRGSEMPALFGFAPEPDAWVPFALPAAMRQERQVHFSLVIGRLQPGVGLAAAAAELNTICRRLEQAYPATDKGWSARLVPLAEEMTGDHRPALLLLWSAVGIVLLIACANVANLLLARAASRQREIAVRTAIGAARSRLIAQLLIEAGLLSLIGGGLGVVLAVVGLRAFSAYVPVTYAGATTATLDFRVLGFTLLLCVVTTLLAGLVPALQMTRPDLAESLREGTRAGSGTVRGRWTQKALVTLEVAITVLVLIGAGLLLRSFVRLIAVDPGFRSAHVLTFEANLPPDLYPPARLTPFFNRLADRLKALPGVTGASVQSKLPLTHIDIMAPILVEGRPIPKPEEIKLAEWHTTFPGYFAVMGIPLKRGRDLAVGDTKDSLHVVVVDEALAQTYWPQEDPIGKRFRYSARSQQWLTVVGVAGSTRSVMNAVPQPQVYEPSAQVPEPMMTNQLMVVVRTTGDPRSIVSAVRAAVHEIDPAQPVTHVRTLEKLVDDSLADRRFSLLLLGLFALLALVLSTVGIYGLTAYSVVQRTRELGLRMALGALPQGVLGLVLREAGKLTGVGVVLGLVLAYAFNKVIASLVYGVGSTDPLTFFGVALGILAIALLAAYLPGRRATRVDPIVALRTE